MSYVGNTPQYAAFITDTFNGNNSTVAFTMSVAPANTASIIVAVTGVLQDPSTYSVNGLTLTFSQAPPTGTGNISVRYLGIPASGITNTAYRTVTEFTATSGQTTFTTPSYTVGYINVYINGVRMASSDFTATSGTTVVMASPTFLNDIVVTESFYVSSVLNALSTNGGVINGSLTTAGTATFNSTITHSAGTANGVAYLNSSKALTTGSALVFDGTNFGLGVTPNAYQSGAKAFQNPAGALYTVNNLQQRLSFNAYRASDGNDKYIANGFATEYRQSEGSGIHSWHIAPSSTAGNNITFTQAMTLDASGNLLVGTTSVFSGGKLCIKGASNYDGKLVVDNGSTTGGGIIQVNQNGSVSGSFLVRGSVLGTTDKNLAFLAETGLGIYTYTNGGTAGPYVASGGTSWTNSSDERLKNITGEIQNGLTKVCSLRAAEFTWKSDESAKPQVGLIAQDVQAVLPQAVNQSVKNKDDQTEYLGVSYTDIIPLLVAAIKEQQALITQLQTDVAALKGVQT
jgi:hypothetical protein